MKENSLALTEEFEEELRNFTTSYTQTQKQNDVLSAVNKFTEAMNDLIELKILRNDSGTWSQIGDILMNSIVSPLVYLPRGLFFMCDPCSESPGELVKLVYRNKCVHYCMQIIQFCTTFAEHLAIFEYL